MRGLDATGAAMSVTVLAQEAAQHLDTANIAERDLRITLMRLRMHLDQIDAALTVSAQALDDVLQQDTVDNWWTLILEN